MICCTSKAKKIEMLGKLQIKLGKTKEELHKIIDELMINGKRRLTGYSLNGTFNY